MMCANTARQDALIVLERHAKGTRKDGFCHFASMRDILPQKLLRLRKNSYGSEKSFLRSIYVPFIVFYVLKMSFLHTKKIFGRGIGESRNLPST